MLVLDAIGRELVPQQASSLHVIDRSQRGRVTLTPDLFMGQFRETLNPASWLYTPSP